MFGNRRVLLASTAIQMSYGAEHARMSHMSVTEEHIYSLKGRGERILSQNPGNDPQKDSARSAADIRSYDERPRGLLKGVD